MEAWEGCCVGDLETPSDHLRENACLLCVSHCIDVSQSKRTVQGYEGFEKLFVQCNHNEIVVSWRLNLAPPDGAELKAHTLLLCLWPCEHALREIGLELKSSGRGQLDVSVGVTPMP